jgi:hypothetical protein
MPLSAIAFVRVHLVFALDSGACYHHPGTASCSGNSSSAVVLGALIIATPVVLWLIIRLWFSTAKPNRRTGFVGRAADAIIEALAKGMGRR